MMTRKLSKDESNLWSRVTRGIRQLGQKGPGPKDGFQLPIITHMKQSSYDPRLDLHGLKIQEAFEVVKEHIAQGALLGYKKLVIITGKSGQINIDLPRWIENDTRVRSIDSMNGGGAWQICLKNNPTM